MSNHLAIATVTAAFSRMLAAAAQAGVAQAGIRLGPPDAKTGSGNKPLVNIFLYQVVPNAHHRNTHMPTRRGDGSLSKSSRVALDLHYVVSYYGSAAKYEPERMMGAVSIAIEDRPIITRDMIERAIVNQPAILEDSDLALAPSTVRVTPESPSVDELSKIWSIFFQVPYALSATYRCSHVSIETDDDDAPAPLPVTRPRIYAGPIARSTVDSLQNVTGSTAPILWGDTLLIRGQRLNVPGLSLRIAGRDVTLTPEERGEAEIKLKLEASRFGGSELPAGLHAVQAMTPPPAGGPAHLSRASDARSFALRPRATVVSQVLDGTSTAEVANGELVIRFHPKVSSGQDVRLILDERTPSDPQSVILTPKPHSPAEAPASQLTVPFSGLRRSKFLVRVQVDGVESAPDTNATPGSPTFGQITGPEVDLT